MLKLFNLNPIITMPLYSKGTAMSDLMSMTDLKSFLQNKNNRLSDLPGLVKVNELAPNEVEINNALAEANKRVYALVSNTQFIGYGGAKINTDGTFEVMANTGSDIADEKLKEVLNKTFSEDEKLNELLDKIRTLSGAQTQKNESAEAMDAFVKSEEDDAPTAQYKAYEAIGKSRIPLLYHTTSPYFDAGGIKSIEKWINEGGEYPNLIEAANSRLPLD